MNRFFFREQVRDNPRFLGEMIAFNEAGERLRLQLPAELEQKVLAHRGLRRVLRKRGLLEFSSGDGRTPFWDFTEESERLALLEASELEQLGKLFAAAVLSVEMASAVTRAEVFAVKAFFGEDIYQWGLMRGRYQVGSIREPLIAASGDGALPERAGRIARIVLETMRASWPAPLQERSRALFASLAFPAWEPDAETPLPPARQIWATARKILSRECEASWARCFR